MLRTFSTTGTDDRGYDAKVTIEIAEPDPIQLPAYPPMLAGVTVDPRDLMTGRLARYPGARLCRVFWGPGDGHPKWSDPRLIKLATTMPAGVPRVIPHVSWKDWDSAAAARTGVTAFLDGLTGAAGIFPAGEDAEPLAVLTWMHEPEPKGIDAALYRRNWWDLGGIVGDHPNGELVDLVAIQTLQWTESTKPGKGNGDLTRYYAGVAQPGIDCYANSWEPTYPDPVKFLQTALQLADRSGAAPCIPELGAMKLAYDPTGARRADWIRTVGGILKREGCSMVSWWDDLGTGGVDFRLDDKPSADAWRDVIAGNI